MALSHTQYLSVSVKWLCLVQNGPALIAVCNGFRYDQLSDSWDLKGQVLQI